MNTSLFILRPIGPHPYPAPWNPWYDKTFGLVVEAESVEAAREIASKDADGEDDNVHKAWLDESLSTCEPLVATGEPRVIMTDFHAT